MTRPLVSRRTACMAALTSVVAMVAACGSGDPNSVAEQAKSPGYFSGDGALHLVAPEDRAEAVSLKGETLKGETWVAENHRGSVVVVNLWVSWCGPCHAEAPDLVAAYQEFRKDAAEVTFIGIDYRETSVDTGRAQAESWDLPYDSIYDAEGKTALQMQGTLSAPPSTAILDRKGRIAAVVLGAIDRSTLTGLVRDTLEEG